MILFVNNAEFITTAGRVRYCYVPESAAGKRVCVRGVARKTSTSAALNMTVDLQPLAADGSAGTAFFSANIPLAPSPGLWSGFNHTSGAWVAGMCKITLDADAGSLTPYGLTLEAI